MNFDQAFAQLLGHEGAYSFHPADPGGETMWGITQRVAVAQGYTGPMKDLTTDQAKVIYRTMYWDKVQADKLPAAVRFDVFDAAVNSGVGQAAKWLQRAVDATADGVIGLATLKAANALPDYFIHARFNGLRLQFMTTLPTWPSFGRGWAKRIATNLIGD